MAPIVTTSGCCRASTERRNPHAIRFWIRRTIASLGGASLVWTTLVSELPWLERPVEARIPAPAGDGCPAKAKTANLNFTLKDIHDQRVKLSNYKGKVILLDFWATWCAPCKVEIPWFMEFQDKYGEDGLQVVGISVDDRRDTLVPYVRDMQMNYTVLQGRGNDSLLDAFGPMPAIPVTVLISREGRICAKYQGAKTKEAIEQGIRGLL